jgi:alpha-beta hydrolase superfamily lysophospholipase
MLQLSIDKAFHFELLRVLATTRFYGADVAEVLSVAEKIKPGDFESWYQEFIGLAQHIHAGAVGSRHPVSVRNALFRAATYYRAADFFLHGNPDDSRITEIWDKQTACFDRAISLMEIPGKRFEIEASEFKIPAILYKADKEDKPRPTLLMCNGYDGSQEEMLHFYGFAALERGFNVITFEGPGQPSVVRNQKIGFIAEWEKAVTPLVDYCQSLNGIDTENLVLLGCSLGGFLAPRAAAFEHRLAAVVCVDGVFDVYDAYTNKFPPASKQLLRDKNKSAIDEIMKKIMLGNTNLRWGMEQGCWSFMTNSAFDFLEKTKEMTMKNIAANIQCPVLVCEAEADHFFAGQPQCLADALGMRATYCKMTVADAAQEHCHTGAFDFATSKIMDWIEDRIL